MENQVVVQENLSTVNNNDCYLEKTKQKQKKIFAQKLLQISKGPCILEASPVWGEKAANVCTEMILCEKQKI